MADLGGVLRGINMGVTVLSAFMFFKADLAAAAAAAFAPLPFLPAIGKSISYRQKKKSQISSVWGTKNKSRNLHNNGTLSRQTDMLWPACVLKDVCLTSSVVGVQNTPPDRQILSHNKSALNLFIAYGIYPVRQANAF